ncbi:MAG: hypothetical protein Q4G22_13795 [Paracoccus sp. (in: a-proteobacteria)]|uniref:hypothetical protein n=1 Tax=Paracoccus sp. TaxID=267 RepID=UPI0026DFE28E|nr:hypothetical protein [Paracoccus sp. (in: a-proteobacteria)]MDO5632891.1 hypothetical protein [Paracoccus sp. (in: a-proteobacteria)]
MLHHRQNVEHARVPFFAAPDTRPRIPRTNIILLCLDLPQAHVNLPPKNESNGCAPSKTPALCLSVTAPPGATSAPTANPAPQPLFSWAEIAAGVLMIGDLRISVTGLSFWGGENMQTRADTAEVSSANNCFCPNAIMIAAFTGQSQISLSHLAVDFDYLALTVPALLQELWDDPSFRRDRLRSAYLMVQDDGLWQQVPSMLPPDTFARSTGPDGDSPTRQRPARGRTGACHRDQAYPDSAFHRRYPLIAGEEGHEIALSRRKSIYFHRAGIPFGENHLQRQINPYHLHIR